MTGGDESWELRITVPPVTEDIHKLKVRCGRTVVVVERDNNGWAPVSGGAVAKRRPDYEGAVADARRWVEEAERHRLLTNAVAEVLAAEARQGGESRG